MALDHARDRIRVNAVCPGSVDTPMLRASADLFKGDTTLEATLHAWARSHPWAPVWTACAQPREVAELIAFLLSDRASYITGAEFAIDGALLAALGVALTEI